LYIASILCVTKKPPKILIAAKTIAKNPKMFAVLNMFPDFVAKAAIIAPTIITEEIAFVTDIRGVCKEGVTLQTT
tara:strand:+ start:190 stop:414 length:225 start_codon:yes stop_codon:yes gene_type:complete